MQLANITTRPPHLVQALAALSQHADHQEAAQTLIHELSGITVLVARKFTNDRTADGLLEAFYLTVGCISLGISQANIPADNESQLSFLLHHGAEYVFQMGFRHIKELSSLPYDSFSTWTGNDVYKKELQDRQRNQKIVACAKWLRLKHCTGPVKDPDLDANAVIAISVIFSILGDERIVARTGQKEIENMINRARETRPDIEAGWSKFLTYIPPEYHPLLRERMDEYRSTIVKKILSKTRIKTVVTEIQDYYAGNELEIDYP